jgi:hypothetical protein
MSLLILKLLKGAEEQGSNLCGDDKNKSVQDFAISWYSVELNLKDKSWLGGARLRN